MHLECVFLSLPIYTHSICNGDLTVKFVLMHTEVNKRISVSLFKKKQNTLLCGDITFHIILFASNWSTSFLGFYCSGEMWFLSGFSQHFYLTWEGIVGLLIKVPWCFYKRWLMSCTDIDHCQSGGGGKMANAFIIFQVLVRKAFHWSAE